MAKWKELRYENRLAMIVDKEMEAEEALKFARALNHFKLLKALLIE